MEPQLGKHTGRGSGGLGVRCMRLQTHPSRHEIVREAAQQPRRFVPAAYRGVSWLCVVGEREVSFGFVMKLFSIHCRLCGGSQFRVDTPEGWLETQLFPRLFIAPGRCTACFKRCYRPLFFKWEKSQATWP